MLFTGLFTIAIAIVWAAYRLADSWDYQTAQRPDAEPKIGTYFKGTTKSSNEVEDANP